MSPSRVINNLLTCQNYSFIFKLSGHLNEIKYDST